MADYNSLNLVILIGWLGKDPDLQKAKGSDKMFCRMSMATNETFKDSREPRVEWHNLTAFGKVAQFCGDHLKKGALIQVSGKMRTHYYAKEGENRKHTDVHVESLVAFKGLKFTEDKRSTRNREVTKHGEDPF